MAVLRTVVDEQQQAHTESGSGGAKWAAPPNSLKKMGDSTERSLPKRAHMSSPCRRQPIFSWHLIQEMSRIDASILDSRWPLEIRGGIRGNRRAAPWRPHCPASGRPSLERVKAAVNHLRGFFGEYPP